uniref:Ribonuclease H-like domain-containing protein n=1 Tax=Tanacetum cinerariifolium TaxID=118510 RepID=A0A6L2LLS7_TANCI|nr:ribonuclease H-like domain-containing protein [Tanacetum cinerariifolium]
MMGISNEHQLKFNLIKDAKQLLEAIEKRFGGNAATKKTQRNLLKHQFENFFASSSEMLDQTFDMLQKRFLKKNGRKLTVNGNESLVFDMSKVERYNCHKRGHFARECRAKRNQDTKHKESTRRSMLVETPASTALVSCDGLGGYDWSDQAKEVPNYALMAYISLNSDSKVSNDSACSKSCFESVKLLKSHNEQLLKDLKKLELMVLGYKTGLQSLEEILTFFKKNEFIYLEDIKVLKVKIQIKDIAIKELRRKLEVAQKEKEGIHLTVEKLENASKSLNKLIDCHIIDNCKKGLGYESYNAIPPPYTGNFMPPKPDLYYTGLDEFAVKPVVENKSSEEETKTMNKLMKDMLLLEETPKVEKSQKRVPRKNNMYSVDLKNIVPKGGLTCLFTKATSDESKTWHRRLRHLNFKTINELVKRNLVREAVNTACYVQNRVLVVKPHNKTLYELFHGRTPTLSFMRPFGYPVTILNTKDHISKFDGSRPDWLFDINALKRTMNYESIVAGTQSNDYVGKKVSDNAGQARKETEPVKDIPLWTADPPFSQDPKSSHDDGFKPLSDDGKKVVEDLSKGNECTDQEKEDHVNNTNNVNSTNNINIVSSTINAAITNNDNELLFDPNIPAVEDVGTFDFLNEDEDDGEMADMNNFDTLIQVSPTPSTRIHKDHLLDQVIGDLHLATQTRQISKNLEEHGFVSTIQQRANHKDLQNCLFACFLSQEEPKKPLLKDEDGEEVDVHMYRSMIGSLMYLTSLRRNIMFAVCACARYQVNPKVSRLHAMKRICRKPKRKYTQIPQPSGSTENVVDEVVYKERGDRLVKTATTASSLEAEQDSGNIDKTQSKATPNEASSPGTTSGGGPRCQEAIGDTIDQTRFENVSKLSNDSLLARGNTLQSNDDSLKLNELMEVCTNLQSRVLALEKTKTTQALEITSLKKRVKKLKKKQMSRTHKLKRLYKVGLTARVDSSKDEPNLGEDASKQGRIKAIDTDEDITLVNDQDDAEMFDVSDAGEINAASIAITNSVAVTITTEEVILDKALVELKASKPKVKGVFIQEPSESITTTTTISLKKSQDKGKGIMVEEPVKPKKKEQIRLDEETALKLQAELQAEFEEEQRLARECDQKEQEANIALIKEWDDIQVKIDVDYQLVQRLQAEEQQELNDAEKATLFMPFLEKRREFFAAKASEEKRNKPPTQAQQRKIMSTYLKNVEGKKLKDLKNKSFDSIQKMFDRAFKRVNTFVDFRTELVKGSSKRAGEELKQGSSKKQKVNDNKEIAELKELMKIIPDEEEVAIDVIPLAVKSPKIVD